MSQMGVGAMIHYLGGGSEHSPSEYVGQTIMAAELKDDRLRLALSPVGKIIEIWDNGQSCCEIRHMTTDDDVSCLVGGTIVKIEAKAGPDEPCDYGCHDTCFVEVSTDKGFITVVNHNEHNGYYGGFGLTITEVDP